MSVWEAAQGTYRKYGHWPDPFENMVKNIKVLACEGTLIAQIEMIAAGLGEWWFSQFVPQPNELVRKTLAGSYKCGFFLLGKQKSPLDLIWRDGSASKAFGQIIAPVQTVTYYIWAISTIYEALSTWGTLIYAMFLCNVNHNEVVEASGFATFAPGAGAGSPAFYTEMWDPNGWCEPNTGQIQPPVGDRYAELNAFGTMQGNARGLTSCIVHLRDFSAPAGQYLATIDLGSVPVGGSKDWHIQWEGINPHAVYNIYVEWNQPSLGTLPLATCEVTRWIATISHDREPVVKSPMAWQPNEKADPKC